MSVSYPGLYYINLPHPMQIGDAAGQNGVEFTYLSEPVKLPEPMRKRKVVIHEMASPALGQPGNRVIEVVQTNVNHWDVEWEAGMLTPKQIGHLLSYVDGTNITDDPGYVTFTLGAMGTTDDPAGVYYLGMMAEDYPKIVDYQQNLRMFQMVQIKIHVIGLSTITSMSIASNPTPDPQG
jgi:hypothetical protein